jgi:hypothetical protein
MGRISEQIRERIAKRFDFQCPLCSIPFLSYDVHHMKYFSIGGLDDEENLIPLCPSCHRTYGHKLRATFDLKTFQFIRNDRLCLVSVETEIRFNISRRPKHAARVLLRDSTRDLILKFGRYHRYLVLSKHLMDELPIATAKDRALKARISIFCGEMSLYCDKERDFIHQVKDAITVLGQASELSIYLSEAQLIAARLAGRANDYIDEQEFMDEVADGVLVGSKIYKEWLFRQIAYLKKTHQFEKALNMANSIHELSLDKRDRVLRSNILSEVGRIQLYLGEVTKARDTFQMVMDISVEEFHRRGILLTSIFLARTNIVLKKYNEAVTDYLLASQCLDVASSNDKLALEEIKYTLEGRLGESIKIPHSSYLQ